MNYQTEINLLKQHVKSIYNKANEMIRSYDFKGEQDIVTSTDLYIETHVIELIKTHFPKDHFHSEEFNKETELKDRTWIIDPIDGTSNYAVGLGLYVVQIALYDHDDIVLSYIYMPAFDKTYYAVKGHGAYLNDMKYLMTDRKTPSNFMISMVGMSHKNEDKYYYNQITDMAIKHKYKLRMLGSIGLELALGSEGIFDLFYTNVSNLWDICPGICLIREAGGLILNEKGLNYQLGDQNMFVYKDENVKDDVSLELFGEHHA